MLKKLVNRKWVRSFAPCTPAPTATTMYRGAITSHTQVRLNCLQLLNLQTFTFTILEKVAQFLKSMVSPVSPMTAPLMSTPFNKKMPPKGNF